MPIWLLYSQAAIKEGDDKVAEEALVRVLELASWHPEARFNLAVVRAKRHFKADEDITLTGLYQTACKLPSDIHEHLPTLYGLAKQCGYITEFGSRTGISTTALLVAQPGRLVCYDRVKEPEIDLLQKASARTTLDFQVADVAKLEIEPTDMLLMARIMDPTQMKQLLHRHASKVRRFIAIHGILAGSQVAIDDFAATGEFRMLRRDENNNGLIVLERATRWAGS